MWEKVAGDMVEGRGGEGMGRWRMSFLHLPEVSAGLPAMVFTCLSPIPRHPPAMSPSHPCKGKACK